MNSRIVVNGDVFEPFITEEQIRTRVSELAAQIDKDYAKKVPIFIGILNGSFIFFADLIREIKVDCEVDFFKLSSYGDAKISTGNVRLLKDLNCQVTGRDIVVVEDIVDSGLSMDYIKNLISAQNPKSLRIVTLLYKKDALKTPVHIDYVGFSIPNDFVIGYGLDYLFSTHYLRIVFLMLGIVSAFVHVIRDLSRDVK